MPRTKKEAFSTSTYHPHEGEEEARLHSSGYPTQKLKIFEVADRLGCVRWIWGALPAPLFWVFLGCLGFGYSSPILFTYAISGLCLELLLRLKRNRTWISRVLRKRSLLASSGGYLLNLLKKPAAHHHSAERVVPRAGVGGTK